MVVQNRLIISSEQSVLPQILKPLGLNYRQFARRLGLSINTLEKYRYGITKCKLSTPQIKIMIEILEEVGLTFHDLPDDWIVDKPNN
jgi:transcriptional regulator with XRE-family HTH domain